MLKLKSTNQPVFEVPYAGSGSQPWHEGFKRIFRPFRNPEGRNGTRQGEIIVVHQSKRVMSKRQEEARA